MGELVRRSALLLGVGLALLHPGGARAAELNLVCKVLASHLRVGRSVPAPARDSR